MEVCVLTQKLCCFGSLFIKIFCKVLNPNPKYVSNSLKIVLSVINLCTVELRDLDMGVENYHVIELVGEGSFGKVYKGRSEVNWHS
ncbi:hypothetical protein L1987_38831 [Smallanthus sonchifolius]|uniref:Uncharacterized protein n=1 Tax=Smallanthus sonchifolius TaxID=185202 RepID=A0ACB9HLN2_9ASTR|nr:hypothetical protein L1987_38831 [Smallanthus sonchifolius]